MPTDSTGYGDKVRDFDSAVERARLRRSLDKALQALHAFDLADHDQALSASFDHATPETIVGDIAWVIGAVLDGYYYQVNTLFGTDTSQIILAADNDRDGTLPNLHIALAVTPPIATLSWVKGAASGRAPGTRSVEEIRKDQLVPSWQTCRVGTCGFLGRNAQAMEDHSIAMARASDPDQHGSR